MLFLLFAVTTMAFGLSAMTGGGASLVVVPVLTRLLGVASVPAALSIGTGASSVSRIAAFRGHIRWEIAAWFVPAAVPMALLGAFMLRFVNPAYIEVLMALALLANLPALFKTPPAPEVQSRSRWTLVGVGAVAGFLSGLTGAVGVLFNGFYLRRGLTKQEIVATRATNEVLVHAAKLVTYAALGLIDLDVLRVGAVVAAAAVLSSLLLKPLLQRLPHRVFAKLGYAAMVGSGVFLLGSSASRVVREDRIGLSYELILDGVDAKLRWRDATLAIELELDDGPEVELNRDIRTLPEPLRALVRAEDPGADRILVEEVFGVGRRYYEAYYYRSGAGPSKRIA
ncbi:MAG: sulfite exporter TauE/SafE family protein, partial [Myxococcales bacterium]|nr:sulfite exporter TauE/SafE family protein [Myxococcales bacterium]